MHNPPTISLRAKLGFVLFGLILSLILAEICLAFFYPQKTYNRVKPVVAGIFRESQWLIWELAPNRASIEYAYEGDKVIPYYVQTNSLGFRDEEFSQSKPPQTYRIMTVGDSFTFGLGVDNGQDYPAQLEACLNRRLAGGLRFEVINAGYASGFSPDNAYVFLREIAPPYAPDLVIEGYLVQNDFVDLLDMVWVSEQDGLPGRITSRTRDLNLQGQLTFKSSLPRYRIPILRNSHTFQLIMELLLKTVPTLQGEVAAYDRDPYMFKHVFDPQLSPNLQRVFDQSMRLLSAMRDLGEQNGYDFLTLIIPAGVQVDRSWWESQRMFQAYPAAVEDAQPQARIRAYLDQRGMAYLDLLPDLLGHPEYYNDAWHHWTAAGYQAAAEIVCNELIESRLADHLLAQRGIHALINRSGDQLDLYRTEDQTACKLASLAADDLADLQDVPMSAECSGRVRVLPQGERYQVAVYDETGGLLEDGITLALDYYGKLAFYSEKPSQFGGLPEALYAEYQTYLASQAPAEGIIFNPAQGSLANSQADMEKIGGFIIAADRCQRPPLFDLLYTYDTAQYETELVLTPQQHAALTRWRTTKQAHDLGAAGIRYLFFSRAWYAFLSEEEAAALDDPAQYQPVQVWQQGVPQAYYLYRVVAP